MNEPTLPPELGLPPSWQPAPVTWHISKLAAATNNGNQELFLLSLDTFVGRSGYAFDRDALRRLADQLAGVLAGIEVVRSIIPPTPGAN